MPITNDFFKTINHIYKRQSWSKRYGGQIWTVLFIFFIWAGIIAHLHSKNYVQHLKENWPKNRCLPYILPVAGHIYKPEGLTAFEYTAENFTFCMNDILKEVIELAMVPFMIILASLSLIVDMILLAIQAIRELLAWLIAMIMSIIAWIIGIFANITVVTQRIGSVVPDSLSKLTGLFTTSVNLGQSMFYTMMSGLKITLNLMIVIAIILIIVWIVLKAISMISFFCIGCPFVLPAKVMFIFCTIVCSMLLICAIVLKNAMTKAAGAPMPPPAQNHKSVPSVCFSKNTPIMLNTGEVKEIHEIKLGDILLDGGNVTSTMKCSSAHQDIYNLYGTIVTGKHGVKDKNNKWIHVEEHPDAVLVSNFREPFVYCINTSTKKIIIENTCFSDWDDLDEKDMNDLKNNCCGNTPLPINFTSEDIHLYLDAGFSPTTLIELEDGRSVPLSDVEVNDVLKNGESVQGVVVIDGRDLPGSNLIRLENNEMIECTTNILIYDTTLGTINTYDCDILSTKYQYYYIHLLTNTGTFNIQGVKVGDYNTCLEKYLSQSLKTPEIYQH